MPYAFSVHNFISSVGADAGFAAIIGLAILVLLYFAHARETANLREEATLLAARLQQAEARVAELSRPQPVSAAVPAAERVQVRDQRAGAAPPFAPAGVGAPALSSATRALPPPLLLSTEPRAGEARQPGAIAATDVQPPVAAAAMGGQPAVAMAAASTASASPTRPVTDPPNAPSPAQPGPTGSALPPPAAAPDAAPPAGAAEPGRVSPVPRPATAAGANGGGRGTGASLPPAFGSSQASFGAAGERRPRQLPPLSAPASRRGSVAVRVALGLLVLMLLAAVAVVLVLITGSSHSSTGGAGPVRATNAPVHKPAAAFAPSAVTVAVLNGTSTNQLAHHVAAKLAAVGYREGRVTTAANQTETTTVIAYLPGAKNRNDALHVARALNLRPSAVAPIDSGTQQVACPPPGACTANVVVTVGSDLGTL